MQGFYEELINKEYWDKSYNRLNSKIYKNGDYDTLYLIKESEEYINIVNKLYDGTYSWSTPKKLEIGKSGTTKKRVVYMYSLKDRFVLGVLYRAMNNYFSDLIPRNCYSYKTGVNTSFAVQKLSKTDYTDKYGLKLDISSYFNSVNKEHLYKCIDEIFPEETGIKKTISNLLKSDIVSYKGELIEEYKSLVPGSALGSFFANYCLRDIDNYFENEGIIYARYSDDIILFSDDSSKIKGYVDYIENKISNYGLSINSKKYVHFNPGEEIEYLGLKFSKLGIDVSNHAKTKVKQTIKRWVKKGRREIELDGKSYNEVAGAILKRFNFRMYKCYIEDATKFGWGYYAFRYITLTDSLIEIDYYLKDQLRYLKTGKHNKANIKAITDYELKQLGYISSFEMFKLFKEDFDYYYEVVQNY